MTLDAKWLKRATLAEVKRYKLKEFQGAYDVLRSHQHLGVEQLTSHEDLIRARDAVLAKDLKSWMEAWGIDPSKGRAYLRKKGLVREYTGEAFRALSEKFP